MQNVLLVYKLLQIQFDESGNLIPFEGMPTHVLSHDEKPGLQAIATTSEDLRPDEKHSTVSRDKHSSKEYIEFLKLLNEKYPKGDKIRLVLDNLKVHTSGETRRYLATVPERFEFVFALKHGSWLNMVEGFFSKMTRQMLHGIRVKTKEELVSRIY